MADPIKFRAYAERRGVGAGVITRNVDSGLLAPAVRRDDKGKLLGIDPEHADRLYAEFGDPAQAAKRTRKPVDQIDYFEQRARREAAQAELAEIEVAEKKGELIPKADIEKELGRLLRQIRDEYLRVFDRADIALATIPSASHVRIQIRKDSRNVLNELADRLGESPGSKPIGADSDESGGVEMAPPRAGSKRKRVGRRKQSPELEGVG